MLATAASLPSIRRLVAQGLAMKHPRARQKGSYAGAFCAQAGIWRPTRALGAPWTTLAGARSALHAGACPRPKAPGAIRSLMRAAKAPPP